MAVPRLGLAFGERRPTCKGRGQEAAEMSALSKISYHSCAVYLLRLLVPVLRNATLA